MDHYADDLAELTAHLDLHDAVHVGHSEAVIANWWRQGMMGGAKGHYECISGFIQEDYSADLKKISVPALLMNGEADQIVPCATSGPRAVELVQNGTLKTYPGFPYGMPTTHAETINADLLRDRRIPQIRVRDLSRTRRLRRCSAPAMDTEMNWPCPGTCSRSIKPRLFASSHTGRRGHDVRHASRTSA